VVENQEKKIQKNKRKKINDWPVVIKYYNLLTVAGKIMLHHLFPLIPHIDERLK
jgi:hypothetical protein